MSVPANKAIAGRIYEAFNARDLSALDELLARDAVDHTPGERQTPGLDGIKHAWGQIFTAFPGIQAVVEDIIAEGDKVASRVTFIGLERGGGQPGASGRMMEFFRVEGGKVVELWNIFKLR